MDNKIIIIMIGFDIGRIIMLYYKHYAKPGACVILFRIRNTNSLSNKNSFNLSFNTVVKMLLLILLYGMLIFLDYVEICNSSVDGFTQYVSYFFCCNID